MGINLDIAVKANSQSDIITACHRLLSYNPQSKVVRNYFPDISKAADVISQIAKNYVTTIAKDPNSRSNFIALSFCYLILRDFPNAYSSIAHAIRIDDKISDSFFWYAAGILHQHFSYYQSALNYFSKIEPQFPHQLDLIFRTGLCHRNLSRFDDAIKQLKLILDNPPGELTKDDILFQIAFTHQLGGQGDQAEPIYDELLRRHPNCLELIQQYSWWLSFRPDPSYTERADTIIKNSPPEFQTDPILCLISARTALQQKEMSKAYHLYRQILTSWTDSSLFWCGLGNLYFCNDQFDDAVIAYQRALFLQGDIIEAWLNLGLIYQKQGDYQNAIKIYHTALSSCNDSPRIRDRIDQVQSPRNTVRLPDILDITEESGNRLFPQVLERFTVKMLGFIGQIPANKIGEHTNLEESIRLLSPAMKSIFSHAAFVSS